jgi:cysteine-S-conjugate beta-lyase
MPHNFDEFIPRAHTNSVKYDLREKLFGRKDLIPMWVADMDFRVPPAVSQAVKKRAEHEIYGYTFRPESFYRSVTQWTEKRYRWSVSRKWTVFTPGIVPGINLAIMALTNPGDKIMIQPPVYFPFFHAIKKNKRTLVENQLILNNGRYHIDLDDFEEKLKQGVKLFILSNPHNPGGSVWTDRELKEMGKRCCHYGAKIIADEIHADIVFSEHPFTPMASVNEEIAEKTITFLAPSKTFNIAGLSTSIAIVSNLKLRKALEDMIDKIHISHGNIFGQVAMESAYNYGEKWLDELIEYLKDNVRLIEEYMNHHIEGINLVRPEGTYLAWLDCRELPIQNNKINRFMVKEAGVGMNEGATFGKNGTGFQRMNFGCPRQTLKKALENIKLAVRNI